MDSYHSGKCGWTETMPHPNFPDLTYISMIHVCGLDEGHDGEHMCRNDECDYRWNDEDQGVKDIWESH